MKFGQLVIGPAGCGKSTWCYLVQTYYADLGKTVKVVNLDPAADTFRYDCVIDVRHLTDVDKVMKKEKLGPNGALVHCMEYLIDNIDWLEEQLDIFGEDDYVLFDCPGQIELYSHLNVMRILTNNLQRIDWRICGVYCLDVNFVSDSSKFISGSLSALSAMIQLELPHVNLLTKCDLASSLDDLDVLLNSEPQELTAYLQQSLPPSFKNLNAAVANLLSEFSMVAYATLNPNEDESVESALYAINNAIQYGEDLEVKEMKEEEPKDEDD